MPAQRRQYWVNRKIQWPFTRAIILISVGSGILGALITFAAGLIAAGVSSGAGDLSSVLKWVISPNLSSLLLIGLGVPAFIAFMAWYGIRLSHRIAGPLIPIYRGLERARQGDFSQPIRIRQTDLLHDLVDELNETLEVMARQRPSQACPSQKEDGVGTSEPPPMPRESG